ncbi:cob(I)yrinic acid a,c-diamide adenosyltransferase [uncultured Thomasclavelia sp.]|uniref:cob(I)yrinic acid a,c-diamide adenosyltransferase n=1 Tax=uncultured Thomasclavelia sp. TaxID=3025759 RepID=UPI0025CF81F0|nr:cob(I)yrinic acid a,c-diamide adenosyltransferase [uncultured Thomasclavelia sp.]
MIQCYYGNGKGKTTAAIGQAIRLLGAGKKIQFIQFLKDGNSSEIKVLKQLGISVFYKKMPELFIDMQDPKMIKEVSQLENELFDLIDSNYDVIILDELLDVITLSLINEGKVYDLLVKLKDDHEIILTGRMPSHKIKPILDYSSEIKKHKHPFDKGIKARKGIEY